MDEMEEDTDDEKNQILMSNLEYGKSGKCNIEAIDIVSMLTMCVSVFCNFSFGKSLGCIAITVSAYTIVCNQEQSLKSYFLASGGALHELK